MLAGIILRDRKMTPLTSVVGSLCARFLKIDVDTTNS